MTQKNLKKIQSFISLESKLEQMNIHRIEVPEKEENLQKKNFKNYWPRNFQT